MMMILFTRSCGHLASWFMSIWYATHCIYPRQQTGIMHSRDILIFILSHVIKNSV